MKNRVHFDLMNKPHGPTPAELYREALNITAYLDEKIDLGATILSEHHLAPYMSDPLSYANAIAARTNHCFIRIQSLVASNYDPMRLAEQTAQTDIVSNGRLQLTLAWGYDPAERAMYPRSMKAPELMETLIPMLRAAWNGEEFSWQDRTAVLKQLPVQNPIPIYIAGMAPAAIKRAAKLGDGFMPMSIDSVAQYIAECDALGKPPGVISPPKPYRFFHVTKDPQQAWKKIQPFAQHDLDIYWQWMAHLGIPKQTAPASVEEARQSGAYLIFSPEEAINYLSKEDGLYLKPLLGGLSPDVAWESIRLLAEEVFPAIAD